MIKLNGRGLGVVKITALLFFCDNPVKGPFCSEVGRYPLSYC